MHLNILLYKYLNIITKKLKFNLFKACLLQSVTKNLKKYKYLIKY